MQPDDQSRSARSRALVFAEADRVLLRRCAESLSEALGGEPRERFDGGDQIFWDFFLAGTPICLHWQQGGGLWVVAEDASGRAAEVVRSVAEHLRLRLG